MAERHSYPAGPLSNVYLTNGYEEIDTPFGRGFSYRAPKELERALCVAVITKPSRLAAAEILYLRLRADWRQEDVAEKLHVQGQTVSLWERGKQRIPAALDEVLRMRFIEEGAKHAGVGRVLLTWAQLDVLVREKGSFSYVATFEDGNWKIEYERSVGVEFEAVNQIADVIIHHPARSYLVVHKSPQWNKAAVSRFDLDKEFAQYVGSSRLEQLGRSLSSEAFVMRGHSIGGEQRAFKLRNITSEIVLSGKKATHG